MTGTAPTFATSGRAGDPIGATLAIVGAGATGLATAIGIARRHPDAGVTLIAPAADPPPAQRLSRTAALFPHSLAVLADCGVDVRGLKSAAPLAGIRMVDQTGRLLPAPTVTFRADELSLEALAWNVANAELVDRLEAVAAATPGLTRRFGRVVGAHFSGGHAELDLDNGDRLTAQLVIAADGRQSPLRGAAGIDARAVERDQVAMIARFEHERPHRGISTELHGTGGPCTSVPLPGNASALVWMERAEVAERLTAGDPQPASHTIAGVDGVPLAGAAFVAALEARVSAFLGAIHHVVAPSVIPLHTFSARRTGAHRLLLVGEAAHAFPPIGAQGLNLGLRDATEAIAQVHAALDANRDPGGGQVTESYHARRWPDIEARTRGVDMLNESLLSPFPMLPLLRGAGLHAMRASPFLRRQIMTRGFEPVGPLSPLPPVPSPAHTQSRLL